MPGVDHLISFLNRLQDTPLWAEKTPTLPDQVKLNEAPELLLKFLLLSV